MPPPKLKQIKYRAKYGEYGEPISVVFVNSVGSEDHDAQPYLVSESETIAVVE